MPLLVNSVPNLAQGVSQQPDNLRYPGQCDEQVNAWATVVEGLVKRPPTNYVTNVDTDAAAGKDPVTDKPNLFTHFVKRDEQNKYVIAVSLGGISAYNLSLGTSIPVAVTSIASGYLSLGSSVTNPLKDLRALTVADYTFLVNKKVEVEKSRNNSLSNVPPPEALIVVKLGDYEKNYDVYIDNTLVPVDTSLQHYHQTAGHTYESGPADQGEKGKHADTSLIARDLALCISTAHTTSRVAIDDITVTDGGSGWLKGLYVNKTKRANRLFYSETSTVRHYIAEDVEKRLEFFVVQTIGSDVNRSAKGYCEVINGVIQDFVFTNRGAGYDPSGTFTLELQQKYALQLTFRGKIFWRDAAGNRNPVTYPVYNTITTKVNPPIRVQHEGSLIKVVKSLTVSNGGSYYILKKEHTSTSDNEPGSGSNSGLYWEQTTVSAGSVAWASGVDYRFNEDIDVRVEDGLANQGLDALYKETSSITDLPKKCFDKFIIKIKGDADIAQDDYYVRFKTKDGNDYGEGSWVETIGWQQDDNKSQGIGGIDTELESSTMPCTFVSYFNNDGSINSFRFQSPGERLIVKNGSNYYYLVEAHTASSTNEPGTSGGAEYWTQIDAITEGFITWASGVYYYDNVENNSYATRQAGDDFTNPFPSFVGQTINDVFFFKNRLGFLTDNAVVFSEADAYFNFFRTTTQQLLDSAPIDVGLSHTKVAQLQHAIPFQEKLMLFSKQSQFVLRGADILSPKTVAISPVTEYDISDSINPVALGNYIYFTFKRNDFEGVYEYFVDNNTETFNAEEITQQVPKYIPKDASKIVGSQTENTLVIGTDADPTTLYVYKYFWSNKEKIQSAWMKFSFGRNVVGFEFIDSQMFLFTQDTDGIHLETLTLEDGLTDEGLAYTLYLDSKVDGTEVTVSLYNPATKKTRISDIPYSVSLGNGINLFTKIGSQRAITTVDSTTIDVNGPLANYIDDGSGDYVEYNGTFYYCVKAHTSGTEFSVSDNWREVEQAPEDTDSWSASTAYSQGVIYKCKTNHTSPSTFVAVDSSDPSNPITYWEIPASTEVTSAPIWSSGNFYYNDKYFVIGKPYNMLYRFSNQTLKQPTERGGRSASDYTYQTMRSGSVNYADTGHFTVEVTPKYRDTYSYAFNPDILGADLALNEFVPQDGHFRFPIQAQPEDVTIEVKTDSALPVKLLAAEFESMFIPRSRRYGS
jgi:uncharacterized protein YcnI